MNRVTISILIVLILTTLYILIKTSDSNNLLLKYIALIIFIAIGIILYNAFQKK